jgi:hypothetical protein
MIRSLGVVAAASCLLTLVGCAHPDRLDESTALAAKVNPELGDGAQRVDSASGPMKLGLAARSTAVPERLLRPFLLQHGYQYGYSRVWQRATEVVTALGMHFFADRDADALVEFSHDRIRTSSYYVGFSDPAVPGSRGFQLTSRVRGATRFCTGEYFAVDRDAFVVTRCADFPVPSQSVSQLAQRQLVYALTGSTS